MSAVAEVPPLAVVPLLSSVAFLVVPLVPLVSFCGLKVSIAVLPDSFGTSVTLALATFPLNAVAVAGGWAANASAIVVCAATMPSMMSWPPATNDP